MNKVELFGIAFDNFDFEDVAGYFHRTIQAGVPKYMLTCNVDHLVQLRQDLDFLRVYREADAVVADGMPVIWASRLMGRPLKQKVSGSDLLPELGYELERRRYRLFFLGAAEGVAEAARDNLLHQYPALNIVGCYSPSYGFEENEEENQHILQLLKDARPDIVLVGVGAPKQEKWINRYCKEYGAPLSIGVGATFDFLAGKVKRAPRWMQRAGLEWCWRLIQEPRRLWRRYLVEDIQFLRMLMREWKAKRRREEHGTFSK